MNRDVFSGQWKQLKGEIRQQWGELTDDEVDQIDGSAQKLAGLLQERYGWVARMRSEKSNNGCQRGPLDRGGSCLAFDRR